MQIIETIDVDVPVTTAYNQWTQFESFPQFLEEVQSITQLDDTHLHWKVKVGKELNDFLYKGNIDPKQTLTGWGGSPGSAPRCLCCARIARDRKSCAPISSARSARTWR